MKYLLCLFMTCFLFSNQVKAQFSIDKENQNNVCILLGENPTVSAAFAARELQYHLQKSVGIQLPVYKGELPKGKQAIYVGESNFTRSLEIHTNEFEDQEYLIQINKTFIILAGKDEAVSNAKQLLGNTTLIQAEEIAAVFDYGKANGESESEEIVMPSKFELQGTCYAVYDFLEKFVGVRWFGPHPNNVVIPKIETLELVPAELKRTMAIKYREGTGISGTMNKELFFHPTKEMETLYGRRLRTGGEKWACNHSFTSFMDRYFTKDVEESKLHEEFRPEYFAKNTTAGERQLCYTNKELIAQVAQDACDYFDGIPLKGRQVALGDYFALVPHDNSNWCTCENCQELLIKDKNNKRGEHFSSGAASTYLFNFVNEVAKLVHEEHPEKKIATLAYWLYAYLPSDFQLESNVSVAPCLQPRNYFAPKIKENDLTLYKQWIEESKESNRPIYLWNYLCFPTERGDILGFNVFPGFGSHMLAEQIKMYANDGVRGVFLCGVGEQLDYYIAMKLYDDPAQNIEDLLNDFFTSYFGNAALPMKKFYTTIEKRYNDPKSYPKEVRTQDKQFHQDEEQAWKYLGTVKVMAELETYMDEAQQKANTVLEKERVNSWKIGIWDYMVDGRKKYLSKQNKGKG